MAAQQDGLVSPLHTLPSPGGVEGQYTDDDEAFLTSLLESSVHQTASQLALLSVVRRDQPSDFSLRHMYPSPLDWQEQGSVHISLGEHDWPAGLRDLHARVASSHQPYCCGNWHKHTSAAPARALDESVAAVLIVPILLGNALIGLLTVASAQPRLYTQDQQQWLCNVATSNAERLANIRAREARACRYAMEDFTALTREPYPTSEAFLKAALTQIVQRIESCDGYARVVDGERLGLKASYMPQTPLTTDLPANWAATFLSIGRPDQLPRTEWSFTGYVAATRRPQRTADAHRGPACHGSVPAAIRAMVGAPMDFRGELLGVLVLHHTECGFFTREHQNYLATFARLLAPALHGFLVSENLHPRQQSVRRALQERLHTLTTPYHLAESRVLATVAHHIADVLTSQLCSIWLVDPLGALVWRGGYGLTPWSNAQRTISQTEGAAWEALRAAFGPLPRRCSLGQAASPQAIVAEVLRTRRVGNYGPNRDALTFAQHGFQHPFLLAPLLTREEELLGVIHVSVKDPTPSNPRGAYTTADEQLLESLQLELADLYERQCLREITEYAAQDLHDALGLITYDLLYGIDALRHAWPGAAGDGVAPLLHDFEARAQSLHGEIRAVMGVLRSHVLEDQGLSRAIETYLLDYVQRPGLQVSHALDDVGHVPVKLAWHLYRIIQEALTNVVKHAEASHAHCELRVRPQHLAVHIYDNGRGLAPRPATVSSGHGLRNLRRRAEGLGGRVRLRSSREGTFLSVRVPYQGGSDVTRTA